MSDAEKYRGRERIPEQQKGLAMPDRQAKLRLA